jgi:sugar transferase (PEP-CTERM system associated)
MTEIRFFKQYLSTSFLLLFLIETWVFGISAWAAMHLRFLDPVHPALSTGLIEQSVGPIWPRVILFVSVMQLSVLSIGLYSKTHVEHGRWGVLLRLGVAFLIGAVALAIVFYFIPYLYSGRGIVALALGIAFLGSLLVRFSFLGTIDKDLLRRRVLVYGSGSRATFINQLTGQPGYLGASILGFVHNKNDNDLIEPHRVIRLDRPLVERAMTSQVDEIVVAVDDRRNTLPIDDLLDCRMSGIDVIDLPSFFERESGKVRLEMITPSWIIFSEGFRCHAIGDALDRLFDVAAGLVVAVLTLPIMAFTALAIKIEDGPRAPVFYRQRRVGKGEKQFKIIKFRSMIQGAEQAGQAVWAQENDSRITRVGAVIRKLRIDELPQVFNVLAGEMSIVGPRPERPEFAEDLGRKIPYYDERHRVKPGITGWAQLRYPYGATLKDAMEKLQYDLYYVKNHSLLFDFFILLQTVEVVLFGKGAR